MNIQKQTLSRVFILAASFVSILPSALSQISSETLKTYEASIDPEKVRAHVQYLSDDLMEGRYPGLRGGELAAKYIATQFALYGLKPAGDNGTYFQNINMVGMKAHPAETTASFVSPSGSPILLTYGATTPS